MPRAGFSPGIATHCPHPSGAGEEAGGRAGWGLRGGIYEFRRLRGGGEPPPRSPPPKAMPTTVHRPERARGNPDLAPPQGGNEHLDPHRGSTGSDNSESVY